MAAIESLPDSSSVYLDTAPLICVMEDHEEFAPLLMPVLERIDAGTLTAVSSYLTLTEVLVKPVEQGRTDLAKQYRQILTSRAHLRLEPLDERVSVEAARVRATAGVRLADAIHLATAKVHDVDVFLTNDQRLKGFQELRVLTVTDLAG